MNIKESFKIKFGNNLKEDVNLASYSWFNLGGNAEFFFKPNNINQLIELMINNGFSNTEYRNLSNGLSAIHSGWKI